MAEIKYYVMVRQPERIKSILLSLDEISRVSEDYIIDRNGTFYVSVDENEQQTDFPKNLVCLTDSGKLLLTDGTEIYFEHEGGDGDE